MARRVIVELVDDLDGEPADDTVRFGLDEVTYEIDLSQQHVAELRDSFARYVAHARKVSTRTPARRRPASSADGDTSRKPGRSTSDREQNAAIRTWARAHGKDISDRGRIPAHVLTEYHQQNQT